MKRYKLLKDLPTFKAEQLAYVSSLGNLMAGTPEEPEITDTGLELMMYHRDTLKKFPNILTEWFEEIKEPTSDIFWKPKIGEEYFYISTYGYMESQFWSDDNADNRLMSLGIVYRTKEKCEAAIDRKLAKARLRKTSDFKPDFKNDRGGWIVFYNHKDKELYTVPDSIADSGEIVRYATKEEAEKSIEENERDWKIYFGIEEEK